MSNELPEISIAPVLILVGADNTYQINSRGQMNFSNSLLVCYFILFMTRCDDNIQRVCCEWELFLFKSKSNPEYKSLIGDEYLP
jgi:hypothetical protein